MKKREKRERKEKDSSKKEVKEGMVARNGWAIDDKAMMQGSSSSQMIRARERVRDQAQDDKNRAIEF